MQRMNLTYTDFNGEEQNEDFYFHLGKAEMLEINLVEGGAKGLGPVMEFLIQTKDSGAIWQMFKKLLLASYGVRTPDGKRFVKSQEIRDSLEQSPAFDDLVLQLMDAEKAAAFISGLPPTDMQPEISAKVKEELKGQNYAWHREGRLPNPKELQAMDSEEMAFAMQQKQLRQQA